MVNELYLVVHRQHIEGVHENHDGLLMLYIIYIIVYNLQYITVSIIYQKLLTLTLLL